MRTTLDVDETTAAKLREMAAAGGVSIDQLLASCIPGLKTSGTNVGGAQDTLEAFDEWAESFDEDVSLLSDDAVSRVSR